MACEYASDPAYMFHFVVEYMRYGGVAVPLEDRARFDATRDFLLVPPPQHLLRGVLRSAATASAAINDYHLDFTVIRGVRMWAFTLEETKAVVASRFLALPGSDGTVYDIICFDRAGRRFTHDLELKRSVVIGGHGDILAYTSHRGGTGSVRIFDTATDEAYDVHLGLNSLTNFRPYQVLVSDHYVGVLLMAPGGLGFTEGFDESTGQRLTRPPEDINKRLFVISLASREIVVHGCIPSLVPAEYTEVAPYRKQRAPPSRRLRTVATEDILLQMESHLSSSSMAGLYWQLVWTDKCTMALLGGSASKKAFANFDCLLLVQGAGAELEAEA